MNTAAQKKEQIDEPKARIGVRDGLVLKGDGGETRVSEEVVAKISGLAVREVRGVHSLVPYGASQTLSNMAKSALGGKESIDLGVKVEVGQIECAIDVRVITNYGESIPRIAESVRNNLTKRIKEMTGLVVKEVNIDVLDLYFEEDQEAVEPPEEKLPRVQ
ncbi:MAG: Asp23/Gls24 family envelope stress response protein [Deltaproteobacteria bacterium]|nr:Asp23/Gls24 family envelope stress response protein [Deltaproteobacteria bacterium]